MTTSEHTINRLHNALTIILKMRSEKLPNDFTAAIFSHALDHEGFLDLIELWNEAPDSLERDKTITDLKEHLEDMEEYLTQTEQDRKIIDKCLIGLFDDNAKYFKAFKTAVSILEDNSSDLAQKQAIATLNEAIKVTKI